MIKSLIAAVGFSVLFAPMANAEPSQPVGANGGAEPNSTGQPVDGDGNNIANGFGSITSQRAVNDGDIGIHVSAQPTPHLGVGNVGRNDQAEFDAASQLCGCTVVNSGTSPGTHAIAVGPLVGYDPHTRPGTKEAE